MKNQLSNLSATAKRTNLLDQVADDIGVAVINGTFPVGEMLPTEPELCARFGVSRTVVREAVKLLSSKGLLKTSSGKGTWVPPANEWNYLDPRVFSWIQQSGDVRNTIRDLFAFRRAIEPAAAAEAATSGADAQIEAIGAALKIMESATNDFDLWIQGDVEFHTAIYRASNNVFMAPLAQIFEKYFSFSFKISSSNYHHQHCLDEHADVYKAIRDRRPEAAKRAVEILLDHADDDVAHVLK